MSQFLAAVTGAGTVVAVGVTFLARTFRPSGLHRAPRPLLRPVEAMDRAEAHCPVEHQSTPHVRFATGGAMCLNCRPTNTVQGDS